MKNSDNIFISYATEDSTYAYRIYYDLKRSGLSVWLYERDGKFGENFRNEVINKLHKMTYFFLIDSQYARDSKYVKEECLYFNNIIKSEKSKKRKIFIALIESPGKWRDKELFEKQNEIRYIDFTGIDHYDSREKYKSGMDLICNICGKEYIEWSQLPSERDFIKEISTCRNLNDDDRNILETDYKNFEKRYYQKSNNSINRIKIIINDCELMKISAITPYLALGRIQADLNDHNAAQSTFQMISKKFPLDARGWCALGSAYFYSMNYNEALHAYEHGLKLINQQIENPYVKVHRGELIHNIIHSYLKMGKIKNARQCLLELNPEFRKLPEIKIAEIKILFHEDKHSIAHQIYNDLNFLYDNTNLNPSPINMALADVDFQFAKYYSTNQPNQPQKSMKYLENSNYLAPYNLEYKANLALYYHCNHLSKRKKEIIKAGLKLVPNTDSEFYYYGMLKYFNNEIESSYQYYFKSKLTKWPFYSDLILTDGDC